MKHRYLSPIIGSLMWSAIFSVYILIGRQIPDWMLWVMVVNIVVLAFTGYMEDLEMERNKDGES